MCLRYSVGIWATSQSASAWVSSSPKFAPGMSPTTASGWMDSGAAETALRTTSILGQPLLEAFQQHQVVAVALKQGQQVLLGQAELLRQQVALPGVHGHALGPGLPQPAAVGAGRIRGKIAAVVFDDPHLQPAAAQDGQQFFQQSGLSAAMHAADGQHRRAFQLKLIGQSLFRFTVQSKAPRFLLFRAASGLFECYQHIGFASKSQGRSRICLQMAALPKPPRLPVAETGAVRYAFSVLFMRTFSGPFQTTCADFLLPCNRA